MSAMKILQNSTPGKRNCVICRQSAGILICHGCQLTFCTRHVVQHREELTCQLEDIMQNHKQLREDIEQPSNEYFYLRKIDQWEKESIRKIQKAAETARKELKQMFDRSKRRLTRIAREFASNLNSSWKADDYAENDLIRWKKQLNELREEIKSVYSVQLIEDQRYPIFPITFTNDNFRNYTTAHKSSNLIPYESFSQVTGSASIENNGLIVKHIGPDNDYAHILGKQLYSQGSHTIRFKILQSSLPYTIFFGCISAEIPQDSINYNSSYAVGWFGYNEIYHHGVWNNNFRQHGYDSNEIETGDVLSLTIDCDHRRIELFHDRINQTYRLSVNIAKAHFPWQILVVLVQEDDCVKILPKR